MFFLIIIFTAFSVAKCHLEFLCDEVTLETGESKVCQLKLTNVQVNDVNKSLNFAIENDVIEISANSSKCERSCTLYDIRLVAQKPGKSGLLAHITFNNTKEIYVEKLFLPVKVHRSEGLAYLSTTIGWSYFLAWSVSFYPQIYENYKRKSVVGYNFDFLSFNILGYVMYNIFNWGVYVIPIIQEQYSTRHPKALNPVRPNDIFFSTHSLFAVTATLIQCLIYESGDQKVSKAARIILGLYLTIATVSTVLGLCKVIWWLDVLYLCSYIKLCCTLKKYVPQAYMNYKRKSTEGWSIGAVILDFLGGILSILQMMLDGYNYDDWNIFLENPAKFCLGLLSEAFCLTFLIQHYVCYPSKNQKGERKYQIVMLSDNRYNSAEQEKL